MNYTTIEAVYDTGVIKLSQHRLPFKKAKVLVTFFDDDKESISKLVEVSLDKVTPELESLSHQALQKPLNKFTKLSTDT